MPKIAYIDVKFHRGTLAIIQQANSVIEAYQRQGYTLTLRQLYYQFVSRDWIPNKQSEYKRLGQIINDGRMAGLIDWNAIEDRTRNLESLAHWNSPNEIVAVCANQFRYDRWHEQPMRPEVWIEKEALAGVFDRVCARHDVPYLCCRGYTSQSEMWAAAMRLQSYHQPTIILHFGDHDPSGIDMSRDICDRMATFGCDVTVKRIALNMSQIEQYNPPPNPAKEIDPRFQSYADQFGDESWELDALEPSVLAALVERELSEFRDNTAWAATVQRETRSKAVLKAIADNWNDVEEYAVRNFE